MGGTCKRKLLHFSLKIPILLLNQQAQSSVAIHQEKLAAGASTRFPVGARPPVTIESYGIRCHAFTSPAIFDPKLVGVLLVGIPLSSPSHQRVARECPKITCSTCKSKGHPAENCPKASSPAHALAPAPTLASAPAEAAASGRGAAD